MHTHLGRALQARGLGLGQQQQDRHQRVVERAQAEGGNLPRQRLVLQRVRRPREELHHAVERRQRHLAAARQLRRRLRLSCAQDPGHLRY